MVIRDIEFVGSFEKESQCPKVNRPEYAFIGRSNVGKSSLINMICQRKALARVSNTPGKTQTLNFFDINAEWFLVDLPGYGYAKISKKMRAKWEKMIEYYLINRPNLQLAFVLIDSRIPLQKIDLEFINWLGSLAIPFAIVYTKTDKLKKLEKKKNIEAIRKSLLEYWNSLPDEFITSAETGEGREELLAFIGDLNNKF